MSHDRVDIFAPLRTLEWHFAFAFVHHCLSTWFRSTLVCIAILTYQHTRIILDVLCLHVCAIFFGFLECPIAISIISRVYTITCLWCLQMLSYNIFNFRSFFSVSHYECRFKSFSSKNFKSFTLWRFGPLSLSKQTIYNMKANSNSKPEFSK